LTEILTSEQQTSGVKPVNYQEHNLLFTANKKLILVYNNELL